MLATYCCGTNYPKLVARKDRDRKRAQSERGQEGRQSLPTGSRKGHTTPHRPTMCVPGGGGSLGPSWRQPTSLVEVVKGDRDHHGNKVGAGDGCREDYMLGHLQLRGSAEEAVCWIWRCGQWGCEDLPLKLSSTGVGAHAPTRFSVSV